MVDDDFSSIFHFSVFKTIKNFVIKFIYSLRSGFVGFFSVHLETEIKLFASEQNCEGSATYYIGVWRIHVPFYKSLRAKRFLLFLSESHYVYSLATRLLHLRAPD